PRLSLVPPCRAEAFSCTLVGLALIIVPSALKVKRCGRYGAAASTSHTPTMASLPLPLLSSAATSPVTPPSTRPATTPAVAGKYISFLMIGPSLQGHRTANEYPVQ